MAQGPMMNNLGVPGGGRNNLFLLWLAKQGAAKPAASPVRASGMPTSKAQWKNMEEFERVRMELQDNARANEIANMSLLGQRQQEGEMAQMFARGDIDKDLFSHGLNASAENFERLNKARTAQDEMEANAIRQAAAQAQADATPSPYDSAETTLKAEDEAAESGDATTVTPGGAAETPAGVQAPADRSPLDRTSKLGLGGIRPIADQIVTTNVQAGLGQGISAKLFSRDVDAELTADKQARAGKGRGGPAEVGGPKEKGKGKGEKEGGKVKEETKVDPLQAALDQVKVPITPGKDAGGGPRRIRNRGLSADERQQLQDEFPNFVEAQGLPKGQEIRPEEYSDVVRGMASNAFANLSPEDVKGLSTAQRKKLDDWVVRPVDRGGPAEPPKAEEEPVKEPVVEKPKGKGGRKKKEAPPVEQGTPGPVKETPADNGGPAVVEDDTDTGGVGQTGPTGMDFLNNL